MARNGSGIFSLLNTVAPPGAVSNSTNVNATMNDIADGISDSINKDGTMAFAANQSMGSNKLTSLANGTASGDAANIGQVQNSIVSHATAVGGTVDAITLTFSPAFLAYTSKMKIRWTSAGVNTSTTPTINVDGLGAKTVKKGASAALAANDIGGSGSVHEAVYDGTDFILLNPISSTSGIGLGKNTIWVPARAMTPRTTNGAATGTVETSTNFVMIPTLDFDTTTQEFAQFAIQMPKGWDEGTLIFQVVWSHAATTTNFGVAWQLAAVAFADDDALDTAFGTAVIVTDTGGTTNDVYITAASSALTVAGSPGNEEYVVFQVARVPANGSDTMAIDARLHGIKIHYTISSLTDD